MKESRGIRRGWTEGQIVAAVAVVVVAGLAGLMAWQAMHSGSEPQPSGPPEDAGRASALERELGEVRGALSTAESERGRAVIEAKEARLMVVELRRRNEGLQERAELLEARLATLAARAGELPPVGSGSEVAPKVLDAARVVDANEALQLVVLNVGARDGVRPGMVFRIVQEGIVTARVRAVDVRDAITGAAVDEIGSDGFPAEGDRAVLGAAPEA